MMHHLIIIIIIIIIVTIIVFILILIIIIIMLMLDLSPNTALREDLVTGYAGGGGNVSIMGWIVSSVSIV